MNSETVADTRAFHALPVPDVAAPVGAVSWLWVLGAAVVAFAVVEADKLFWHRVAARRGTGKAVDGERGDRRRQPAAGVELSPSGSRRRKK